MMTRPSALSLFLSWSPALLAMAVVFWLSSLPGDAIRLPGFRFSDKAVHFLAYGALGILIGLRHALLRRLEGPAPAFAVGRPGGSGVAPAGSAGRIPADRVGAAVGILYGLSDEVHQMFVPLREASASDFVADALGILAGLYVIRRLIGLAQARTGNP